MLLSAFNKVNKQAGYFFLNAEKNNRPKELCMQDCMFLDIQKAKSDYFANNVIE